MADTATCATSASRGSASSPRGGAESESTRAGSPQDHAIGVTQVVSDGPEGDVTYHLQVGDGEARSAPGRPTPSTCAWSRTGTTAVAVATGELNAQEAFVTGRIRFYGDQQVLIDSQPVFAALDNVFSTVRANPYE